MIDYKKYSVLYVDDEQKLLKGFTRAFGDQFRIRTAGNAVDGLKLLRENIEDVALLITDQLMPGEKGVWLLNQVRQLRPEVICILATAYSDIDAVGEAVNTGRIYQYVAKPWEPQELETAIKQALQLFMVQRERDQLLRERFSVLQNLMVSDRVVSLGLMAASVSHRIRNWLGPVKTFVDMVPDKLREQQLDLAQSRNREFWLDYQQSAQRHIEKISDLLKELRFVAEPVGDAFTDHVHLQDVITDVKTALQDSLTAKRISLEINVLRDLPTLIVDKPKFLRIFELLLTDEIVSLPEGSCLRVLANSVGESNEKRVRIIIRDDGPGLSDEAGRNIFDPFNTRSPSPREHGINLTACFFMVHYHNGTIEAHNAEGGGTEFRIELPVDGNPSSQAIQSRAFFQKIGMTDDFGQRLLRMR